MHEFLRGGTQSSRGFDCAELKLSDVVIALSSASNLLMNIEDLVSLFEIFTPNITLPFRF